MEEQMLSFLLRAKQHTYAAHGAEVSPSRPNSHDLRYTEGDMLYLDTYLGGSQFVGEEAIWQGGLPVWSMNYCGRVLDAGFDGDFLKRALFLVPRERPYRGPKTYAEGTMCYCDRVDGTPDWYQGYEEVLLGETRVYECFYHGGKVQ